MERKKTILGIHDGHNASVALLQNGVIKYALSEERLARIKNKGGFPKLSIERVLKDSGLTLSKIDLIAFSHKVTPLDIFYDRDKILDRYRSQVFPKTENKNKLYDRVQDKLSSINLSSKKNKGDLNQIRLDSLKVIGDYNCEVLFLDHHECHGASAYYSSGSFEKKILCITNDGAGDGLCGTVSICENGNMRRLASIKQENSFAHLYARATFILGMVPLEHEYKLMGMAPYGNQKIAHKLAHKLMDRFEFPEDNKLVWKIQDGLPPTSTWIPYLQELFTLVRFDIVAATLQQFIEIIAIKWIKQVVNETGISDLVIAGGTFMNVKLNKLILDLPEVNSLFIMPSCADESLSIGAAYIGGHMLEKDINKIHPLKDLYLGPIYDLNNLEQIINEFSFDQKVGIEKLDNIGHKIGDLLANGEIVATYFGREEFGARALGNRSILSDPSRLDNITKLNKMIKNRDFWMPFAGMMTDDQAEINLVNPKKHFSPYMIIAFDSNDSEDFKASVHPYDKSIRPQVIKRDWNKTLYDVIKRFESITDKKGGILNTSFNLHGYPIVSSPEDALDVFNRSGLEYIAVENYLISKK